MKGVQQGRLIASNGEWMICIKYRQLNYLSNAKHEHNKLNESNLLFNTTCHLPSNRLHVQSYVSQTYPVLIRESNKHEFRAYIANIIKVKSENVKICSFETVPSVGGISWYRVKLVIYQALVNKMIWSHFLVSFATPLSVIHSRKPHINCKQYICIFS